MRVRKFVAAQKLPLPPGELFPFFADAANLAAVTPPWLRFEILTPLPVEMRAGTEIRYRLRVHGVPLRWVTRIAVWEPPRRFVDEQVRGPYRLWRHEHRFDPVPGGTLMTDRVAYAHLGGPLVHRFLVRPDIERIFAFRARELARRFGEATR